MPPISAIAAVRWRWRVLNISSKLALEVRYPLNLPIAAAHRSRLDGQQLIPLNAEF
jgi:hypothetical protein